MPPYEQEEIRFFAKVNKTDTCWLWTGYVNKKGYGRFSKHQGKGVMAHRWSYEFFVGDIPNELVLDHLCEVKNCVRPNHLEAVTNQENLRRGSVGHKNAEHHRSRTHCRNGHEYTKETTVAQSRKTRGVVVRKCMICYNEQQKRHKDKRL